MEGLLIWLGAKALVVAGLAALFVVVRFACVALLRRLPEGPLKRVLSARDDTHPAESVQQAPREPGDGVPELLWMVGLTLGLAALIWAVYAYNTAY